MGKTKVAVIKTKPESVIDDISCLMQMAGVERTLPKDKTIILKNNISWHLPFLSANTTPWQLEGVIRALRDFGYKNLVCVENNTVVTNAFKGERLNKYTQILRRYGVPVKYNFLAKDMKWVCYQPKGKLLVLDKIFPEGIYLPDYFFGKSVLHLPTLKCHIYTTMTGAMKNAFGGLLHTKRHYTHSKIHATLVDLLMIQQEIHSAIFTVMDGTVCGNGPGPRTMVPVEKNYLLAGADSVAVDTVATKLLGFDPKDIDCIRRAWKLGFGVGDITEIELVGEDITGVNFGFAVGNNFASKIGNPLWFGHWKCLQKLLFRTPLVYLFVFGSFIYHDYFWWPLKGRRVMRGFAKTGWGKLFAAYPQ